MATSKIETLEEFVEWTTQFNDGTYLFRGVPKAVYDMSASAYRRVKRTANRHENRNENFEKFLQINRGLIRDVRLRGHDRKDSRELKDLEILAELQHFRAATCLIDFTYNALVALWFACEQESKKTPEDGKVVTLLTDKGQKFREVTLELFEKDIDYFFLGNGGKVPQQLYKWQPPLQNNRILAQQSIFVFGAVEINPDAECIIDGNSKDKICESLKHVHGITGAMLFPDFEGFAGQHNQDVPYTQLAASQYRKRALQKFKDGKYEEAIADWTEAIKVNPGESSDYQNRGAAAEVLLFQSGAKSINEYKRVIADYTDAINLDPNAPVSYWQRGNLIAKVGRTHEALPDMEKALQIAQAIGEEDFINMIQQELHSMKQFVRQYHSDPKRDSQNE